MGLFKDLSLYCGCRQGGLLGSPRAFDWDNRKIKGASGHAAVFSACDAAEDAAVIDVKQLLSFVLHLLPGGDGGSSE